MRKFLLAAICLLMLASCVTRREEKTMEERAFERVIAYKDAFNNGGKDPEGIYPFLSSDIKARISEEEFVKRYRFERTYPYITPFYIFEPVMELDDDKLQGTVTFQQAARIIGMTWTVGIVYENGDYYFRDWEYLVDGSYLEKFKDIPYSLSWYYDIV